MEKYTPTYATASSIQLGIRGDVFKLKLSLKENALIYVRVTISYSLAAYSDSALMLYCALPDIVKMTSYKSESYGNNMRFQRRNLDICENIFRIVGWCKKGVGVRYLWSNERYCQMSCKPSTVTASCPYSTVLYFPPQDGIK